MKKQEYENYPIDAVVYWVDGNDPNWQREKMKYQQNASEASEESIGNKRYRDWDNLQFIFRGIEKYMPWINCIYFVTCGQIPKWLNIHNPKLKVVNHQDYIPSKYLPTFSANPIELNFHRLPGISEHFIVFNDDFFVINKVKRTDFFVSKKPVDIFMEYPIMCGGNVPIMGHMLCNDFNLVAKHFSRKDYIHRLKNKILSPSYGKFALFNFMQWITPYPRFYGLLTPHFARPYLKSAYEELWALEHDALDKACLNRFRSVDDINIYAVRVYNLMKGNFVPGNVFKLGKFIVLNSDVEEAIKTIDSRKYPLICINDECSDQNYELFKNKINYSFLKAFPDKSSFEL